MSEQNKSLSNDETKPIKSASNRKHPAIIIFALLVIIFLGIIIAPKTDFKNEWDVVGIEYEESKKITDPTIRQQETARILKNMIEVRDKYPYHGRLYLNTAVMFHSLGMLDSAFSNAYLALQKGGGGTVNQLDPFAMDVMIKSTIQKAQFFFNNKDTANAILTFKSTNYLIAHPFIKKTIGSFYANFGSADSALKYLYQAYLMNNRDSEIFYNVGLTYYRRNNIDSAMYFLNQAVTMNPKDAQAAGLINQIKSQGSNENAKNN